MFVVSLVACIESPSVTPTTPIQLGQALLNAGRYAEALGAFRRAVAARPGDAAAELGLGASFEALEAYDSARVVYTTLARAPQLPGRVRRQLSARIRWLARRELEQAAREAVAEEDRLVRTPPPAGTVAVFPFRYVGADTALEPLGRGLAQFFVTDLGHIEALTVLEREHVQILLAELHLGDEGLVDSSTAARSGHLLRAAQVLQGTLQDVPGGERLRLGADVVSTTTSQVAASGAGDDRLQRLFDLEKDVLFQLLDRLGVPLTLVERERLAERPTASLQAFLAFSRGLEAEDRADFAGAAAAFRKASELDPSFRQARERAAAAAEMAQAATTAVAAAARLLGDGSGESAFLADNLNQVMPGGMGGRDPLGDVGGKDRLQAPSGSNGILIRVRRP